MSIVLREYCQIHEASGAVGRTTLVIIKHMPADQRYLQMSTGLPNNNSDTQIF